MDCPFFINSRSFVSPPDFLFNGKYLRITSVVPALVPADKTDFGLFHARVFQLVQYQSYIIQRIVDNHGRFVFGNLLLDSRSRPFYTEQNANFGSFDGICKFGAFFHFFGYGFKPVFIDSQRPVILCHFDIPRGFGELHEVNLNVFVGRIFVEVETYIVHVAVADFFDFIQIREPHSPYVGEKCSRRCLRAVNGHEIYIVRNARCFSLSGDEFRKFAERGNKEAVIADFCLRKGGNYVNVFDIFPDCRLCDFEGRFPVFVEVEQYFLRLRRIVEERRRYFRGFAAERNGYQCECAYE